MSPPKCRLCHQEHPPRERCKLTVEVLTALEEMPAPTLQQQVSLLVTQVTALQSDVKALQMLQVTPADRTTLQCNAVTKSRAEYMRKRRAAAKSTQG